MAVCDLHTHSYYSDGSFSPAQLLELARQAGLSAIALCDHNTVAGLPEFLAAGKVSEVEAIPGVELSTEYDGTELHILGLFIEEKYFEAITAKTADFLRRKEQSGVALVHALQQAGMVLDYDRIKAATPDGYVNRAHVATALVEKGYVGSVKEAFARYLSPEQGYYVPPRRMDAFEAIRFLKSLGAVTVLAHPFLNLDEAALRAFLPEAKASGLDAMETLYPKYEEATTRLACNLAEEYGLLHSGGSDFHGKSKPDIQIGTGKGDLRVSCRLLEKLKEKKQENFKFQ